MFSNRRILIFFNTKSSIYGFRAELLSRLYQEGVTLFISAPESEKEPNDRIAIDFEFLSAPVERRGMNPLKDLKLFFFVSKILKSI